MPPLACSERCPCSPDEENHQLQWDTGHLPHGASRTACGKLPCHIFTAVFCPPPHPSTPCASSCTEAGPGGRFPLEVGEKEPPEEGLEFSVRGGRREEHEGSPQRLLPCKPHTLGLLPTMTNNALSCKLGYCDEGMTGKFLSTEPETSCPTT